MRILIFHGYLLDGTGSNVYNAHLATALSRLGHEVHLCCQDRHAESYPFVDSVGRWESDGLELTTVREPVRCTAYLPPIGRLLPVYVSDRYEGFEAKPYIECSDHEIDAYVARNVDAVAEIAARVRPDLALANHLVMGPLILARALADLRVPYAVKIHGSALEYTVKVQPERFVEPAREGLAPARCVLAGSAHSAESLWEALGADERLVARTRLGPPGVDDEFAPRPAAQAASAVRVLAEHASRRAAVSRETESPVAPDAFARDDSAAADALARVDPERDRMIVFVGKLIVSKGVDLLLAAFPLVLDAVTDARLVIVGFGAFEDALQELGAALGSADFERVRAIAQLGRGLEGGDPAPLRYLLAFLDVLEADATGMRERYVVAAARMAERVGFTGRLVHEELAQLLPACEAQVVPSTFPESFGMVAAEAAACGVLPVSADHSGLAEVTATLARAVPEPAAPWLSFQLGPNCIAELAQRLIDWLEAPGSLRDDTRSALATAAHRHYSWDGVAQGVIAAAEGRLEALSAPLQARRTLG